MAFNLILVKSAPYQGRHSFETVEAIMALALFEIEHRVVFIGDGVSWLFADHSVLEKSLEKQLKALPMYDSDEIYVCRDHLNNFDSANLLDIAEDIDENTVATWLKEASKVEVF